MDCGEREAYKNYFVFWDSEHEFTKYTQNRKEQFGEGLREPHVKEIDEEFYMSTYGIVPGKTVLVVPHSNAVQSFPNWFWNCAIDIFKAIGYKVVVNVAEKSASEFNATVALVPLSDAVGVANLCGMVFGVRTGFFDVISSAYAKMIIYSTKFYKPLDSLYNISNENNRIRTYFYADRDLFFYETSPICYIEQEYQKRLQEIRKNVIIEGQITSPAEREFAEKEAYQYLTQFNKTLRRTRQ